MNYKEAVEYLEKIRRIPRKLIAIEDDIKSLKQNLTAVAAPPFDSEHVNSSIVSDRTKGIDVLIEMILDLESQRLEYYKLRKEAQNIINQINNSDYKIVLTEYYIVGKTMEYISKCVFNFSLQHTYRLRKKALNEFVIILKR